MTTAKLHAVFLASLLLQIVRVSDADCSSESYVVPDFLRCSRLNVAHKVMDSTCESYPALPDCSKVIDGSAASGDAGDWYTSDHSAVNSFIKITFAQPFLINAIRLQQRSGTDGQNKGVRLEFADGNHTKIELTRNTGADHKTSAVWDVRKFAEVTTAWVKIVVESEYAANANGFKEIEFYHDNCDRAKLCDIVSPASGQRSEFRSVHGRTVALRVKISTPFFAHLCEGFDATKNCYQLHVANPIVLTRLDGSGAPPQAFSKSYQPSATDKETLLWFDFRSSKLVVGVGAFVIGEWDDSTPLDVNYISFKADSSNPLIVLCNREEKCYRDADHYWPMDKITGDQVFDLIGDRHGITEYDPFNMKKGPAVDYMAQSVPVMNSNNFVNFGNFGGTCFSDPTKCEKGFTVTFRVKILDSGPSDNYILASSTLSQRGFYTMYKKDGSQLYIKIIDAYSTTELSIVIQNNVWYHVIFQYESSNTRLTVVVDGHYHRDATGVSTVLNGKSIHNIAAGKIADLSGSSGVRLNNVALWKTPLGLQGMYHRFHCSNFFAKSKDCTLLKDTVACGWNGIDLTSCTNMGCCFIDNACKKVARDSDSAKLGVGSGFVPPQAMTDSSELPGWLGRFGRLKKLDDSWDEQAWVPEPTDTAPYLQIDLSQVHSVKAIATKGSDRRNSDPHVKTYTLTYGTSGVNWVQYKESGTVKVFTGNSDATTVVTNDFATPILARGVRIHPKSWEVEVALMVELYGKRTAQNYIGCSKDTAFQASGDYNYEILTPERCVTSCGRAGSSYAAMKKGQECYCASSVDNAKLVGDSRCDEPCAGDLRLRCGGSAHFSVYQASGSYPTSLGLTVPSQQIAFESFNATFSSFTGATYKLDLGENFEVTSQAPFVTYMYHTTGPFVVVGETTTGEYGEPQTLVQAKEVNVYSFPESIDVECPSPVEAGDLFFCEVSVYQGSNLTVEAHLTGAAPVSCPMDDAHSFIVGELFEKNELPVDSGGMTVLIPAYHFEDEGRHTGWELHVQTAGYITLQIYRPVCGRGAEGTHCYVNGTCQTALTACKNRRAVTCSQDETFSASSGVCAANNVSPLRPAVPTPDDSYELVSESHVYLSSPGRHIFHFTGSLKNNVTAVMKGDIVGYSLPASGFAKLVSRNASASDDFNVEELVYNGAFSVGDVLSTAAPSSGKLDAQRSVIAFHQVPSQFLLSHNYTIGVYTEEISVRGGNNVLSSTVHIVASESVRDLNWTYPEYVATNASFDIVVNPHPGHNITYLMAYGEDNLTKFQTTATSDLPFTYAYRKRGEYRVNLMASNPLTYAYKACTIFIEDIVKELAFYAPIQPMPLNNVTVIDWLIRQGSSMNVTVDFGDGTTLDNATFDVADVFVATYSHVYADIGEYIVVINVSNHVSNASIEGMAVVELPIDGFDFTVVHSARDIEVNETITVQMTASVQLGTNPEFTVDFGDGTIVTSRDEAVTHAYNPHGLFNISVWARNNVSEANVTHEIKVHHPVEDLIGFNVTCPPTNLTDATPCMLNITGGTYFKCTWRWGDGHENLTTWDELGNVTYHNYTDIGHYQVALNCTNRLYNTTAETVAIVERPILGFRVDPPEGKPFGQDFTAYAHTDMGTDANFTFMLTHVITGTVEVIDITTLNADTTLCTALIAAAKFPVIGIYELNVTVINYVTPLQVLLLPVYIDIPIQVVAVTRLYEYFILYGAAPFDIGLDAGSNVTLHMDYGDGSSESHFFIGEFPLAAVRMTHAYQQQGWFCVTVFGNNSVSNFTRRVCNTIQGPTNVTTFTSNSPQPIPSGNVTFTMSTMPGEAKPENVTYSIHFGDGTAALDQALTLPMDVSHVYPEHGAYSVNVTFVNEISNFTLLLEVEVQTPIKGLQIFAVHTEGDAGFGSPGRGPSQNYFPLDYPVKFDTPITNGTNVTYSFSFGVSTMEPQVNYTFSAATTTQVTVTASNAVNSQEAAMTIVLQQVVKGLAFTHDGPTKIGSETTFTLAMDQFGTDACYYVQVENKTMYLYKKGSYDCASGCPANAPVKSVSSTPITFTHEYKAVDKYSIKAVGCNMVSKMEFDGDAACVDKPCSYPNVTINVETAGPNVTAAVGYKKSVNIRVESEIEINCEASDMSTLDWAVCKLDSDLVTCRTVELPSDVITNARELLIPKRTLDYGLHIVKFRVTMVGVKGIYTDAKAYIDITKSDIFAGFTGGNSKAVGYGLSTSLDAGGSTDPDFQVGNYSGMEFFWFCAKENEGLDQLMDENATSLPALPSTPMPIANGSNVTQVLMESKGCFGYGPGRLNVTGRTFTFDSSRGLIDAVYVVIVLVTKDTRTATATAKLHVKEGDPPAVTIDCSIGCEGLQKINPSEKLAFLGSATCESCSPNQKLNYLWEILVEETEGQWETINDPVTYLATPPSSKNAVVRPNVLDGGKLYKFILYSWIPSAKSRGFSAFEREVNKPPMDGTCGMTPEKGYTMQTKFNVTCKNWFDADRPLSYALYTLSEDGSESLVTSWRGSKDASNEVVFADGFKLPEGTGVGGNLTVFVEVSDTEKSSSTYKFFVTVEQPKLDEGAKAALLDNAEKDLQLMLSQGNSEAAMSAISNMAKFLTPPSSSDEGEEKKQTEEDKAAEQARMNNLMTKVMDIPVTDPKGAANKAGTIATLLADPSKLSDDAKANAAKALENSANMLENASPGEAKKLSQNLINGVGPAVPQTPAKSKDAKADESAAPVNKTAQKIMAQKLQNTVNKIKAATLSNQSPGEEAASLNSPMLSVTATVASPGDLSAVSSGGSSFGGLGSAVGNDSSEPVGVQSAAFAGNPFAYINGSDAVTGGISEISLKYPNGTPKVVKNLEKPFELMMQNKNPPEPEIHLFDLDKTKTLTFDVVKNRSAVLVQVYPVENNTQIVVCLKKGSKPSGFGNCDFLEVLPKAISVNDSSFNPNSLLVPAAAWNHSAAGKWFVSFKYNGTVDAANAPASSNCTVYIFEAACIYMDPDTEEFSSEGMTVGPQTSPFKTQCFATHMTSFAQDFVVAPNKIDFSKVNLTELMNNPLVFCVVLGFFALYGIMCIWGRRADKKDLERIGVAPLPDNDPRDTYMYEIVVYTGFNSQAGTSSEVRMVLQGGLDETSPRSLRDADPNRRKFCRGNVDYFLMGAPRCLGKLKSLRIWHDNTGSDPSWHLLRIMVHDLQTDIKTWFICDRWFAVEEDDGMVDRTLTPATQEELTSFNLLFSTEARKNLSDNHLWFSVIARPAKSTFTRVQRLTCCISVLMCTMLANAMFYKVDDKSSSGTSVHIGPISFSVKQLSIAIQSSMVVLPANILIVTMFRKARPAEPKKDGLDKDQDPHGKSGKYEFDADAGGKEEPPKSDDDEKADDSGGPKKKKKFTLPHYFVYVAYALAFVAASTTAAFTVFYGLTFGKEKSEKWMSTMMLSFWQDVLISQPLKVFAAAMFFALVIKDPNKAEEENDQNNELTADEEAIHKEVNENEEEKTIRKLGFVAKPPDPEKLEAARTLKLKQKAMKQIIREMIIYFMFLSVLLVVAYGNRDPVAYSVTESMQRIVKESAYTGVSAFEDSSDANTFWLWFQTGFIPTLKPRYWYGPVVQFNQNELLNQEVRKSREVIRLKKKNTRKWVNVMGNYIQNFEVLHRYKEGYIADRETTFLVGSPRLRILRIKKDQCKVINMMSPFFKECMAYYDWDLEDQASYHPKWVPMASNETIDEKKEATPWQYQSAWKLKGTPYWGRLASYWGGGYVADFGADRDKSEALAEELKPQRWIDRYTRAIFSEFTIYNAPTNFFSVITLLIEVLPTGGYYPNVKIQTLRLYRYVGPEMVIVMACELLYMTFLIHFLYKQVKKYRKEGRKVYFSDGWNYLEFFVLLFSISAVTMYFMRLAVTKYTITNMQESPDKYVSFQYAAFLDEWVSALTSLAVFCSILKFLRLLRFNKRVALVVQTIKLAVSPLLSFFLMFFIIFLAYAQFAFTIFGNDSASYASFPNTLSSMLSLTLGSFDFQEMRSINRILGPAFFFSFVLVMFFVLMNVFISILSDAFNEVNSDLSKQSNEHEILDFMVHSFKRTVGKQVAPAVKPKYKEPKTKFELNMDSIEEMSENIEYAMRNLAMEDVRQTNWFDSEAASKKKKMLMKLLLETDEDFTENDICDSIPLFDKLLAKTSEKEMIETLVLFREMKKDEDALWEAEAKKSKKGDSDSDPDSSDDGDPNDDDDDTDDIDSDDNENAAVQEPAPGRLTSLEEEKIMDEIVVLHSRAPSRVGSPNQGKDSEV